MALTQCAIVVDPNTKILQMVVFLQPPDDDSKLSDPSFNPPGLTQVLVSISSYQQQGTAAFTAAFPGLVLQAPVPVPAVNPNPPNPHFVPPTMTSA